MIYHYVVTLKNLQTRYLDMLGLLLSLVSVLFFVRVLINSTDVALAYLLGSIFIIGVLAWNLYQSKYKKKKVYYSRALLIAALVWMKMPFYQWLSFVFIILALLEYQAKYSIEIGFSEKEIVWNSFFKKKYSWNQFNNIVLKDGLLTLDFSNNKVVQREVEDDEEDDADEEEFNNFCRNQLAPFKQPELILHTFFVEPIVFLGAFLLKLCLLSTLKFGVFFITKDNKVISQSCTKKCIGIA